MKCHLSPMLLGFALFAFARCAEAQDAPNERTFPQTKAAIERVIKALQPVVSGRLPVLDGFTIPDERPLARFQRGYYQSAVQVVALPSGGSKVRVNTKITAWYADPVSSRSEYQTLPSNGRIEADLLDQIADALHGTGLAKPGSGQGSASAVDMPESSISAPVPRIPEDALRGLSIASPTGDTAKSLKSETDAEEKHETELAAEAKGLEEILQNQAHPNNLAAVNKSGAVLLQSPSENSKILFPATVGDEFEILDMNSNWVHVRISGLSRGWIRRSSVEMPAAFSAAKQSGTPAENSGNQFRISNEQVAPFPGDWESLRGKIVKIVTVQNAKEGSTNTADAKLKYAKALLMDQYSKLAATSDALAGVVLIFDSEDGGMIAATSSTLKEWQSGAGDEAIWRECFFDPPELSGN